VLITQRSLVQIQPPQLSESAILDPRGRIAPFSGLPDISLLPLAKFKRSPSCSDGSHAYGGHILLELSPKSNRVLTEKGTQVLEFLHDPVTQPVQVGLDWLTGYSNYNGVTFTERHSQVANAPTRPAWYPESFFSTSRGDEDVQFSRSRQAISRSRTRIM
jgi:hypothetical protein